MAGEIGHTTIDVNGRHCKCGNYGCLEAYASGPAIATRAREVLVREESESMMPQMVGGKLEAITAQTVYDAAKAEDHVANEIVRDTARYLGAGIANLLNIVQSGYGGRRRRRDGGRRCAVRAAACRGAASRVQAGGERGAHRVGRAAGHRGRRGRRRELQAAASRRRVMAMASARRDAARRARSGSA